MKKTLEEGLLNWTDEGRVRGLRFCKAVGGGCLMISYSIRCMMIQGQSVKAQQSDQMLPFTPPPQVCIYSEEFITQFLSKEILSPLTKFIMTGENNVSEVSGGGG